MDLEELPPLPASLVTPDRRLVAGRWAGDLTSDPVGGAPTAGRVRRWRYAAAGDADTMVGAAVVDLGFVGVAFAFVHVGGVCATWQVRHPAALGVTVGRTPAVGASLRGRARVTLSGDGGLGLDMPTRHGRLRADVAVTHASRPAVLATGTPGGGWNVTAKSAGSRVTGRVRLGDRDPVELARDAGGWWDWTVGRQDRTTSWRWAAGAGTATDGRRVGLNASTGMNAEDAGEDVVWWDGVPYALDVATLGPAGDDAAGRWAVAGTGVDLVLDPVGARSADERLPLVASTYVQPFGAWTGRLPDPSGAGTQVVLAGVAEDHLAVW